MPLNDSPFLSTKAAAARIGYSESPLEKLRHTGGGPPFCRLGEGRIGAGRVVYDTVTLDEWVRSKQVRSTSEYPKKAAR